MSTETLTREQRVAQVAATVPRPVLKPGAIYFGDNGRAMCSANKCAGMAALHTGRDLSGHPVTRAGTADVQEFADAGIECVCCCGALTLTPVLGADGYPMARQTDSTIANKDYAVLVGNGDITPPASR